VLARAGAAAVLTVILSFSVSGCGGGGDSRRTAVDAYIRQVNGVEEKLQAPVLAATKASRGLTGKNANLAAAAPKLRAAATRIERLRVRLARIKTPPEAKRLRALLLEQTDAEAALAREVGLLAAYLPAYTTSLAPLARSQTTLKAALGANGPVGAKADALDAYAVAIGGTLARLKPLHPPPVATPDYRTQLATLARVRVAATELAKALRAKRATQIPKLVQDFERASLSGQSLAAQRARIAAVKAYNARVRALDTMLLRIDRERLRLQKQLD